MGATNAEPGKGRILDLPLAMSAGREMTVAPLGEVVAVLNAARMTSAAWSSTSMLVADFVVGPRMSSAFID